MDLLPPELQIQICRYCTFEDLFPLSSLNQHWYHLIYQQGFHTIVIEPLLFFNLVGVGLQYFLGRCEGVVRLDFKKCYFVDSLYCLNRVGVKEKVLSRLSWLDLSGSKFSLGEIDSFQRVPNLTYLNLSGCDNLKQEHLKVITGYCQRINELQLLGCNHIDDEGLELISSLGSNLKILKIRSFKITERGIEHLFNRCPNLKTLYSSYCQITWEYFENTDVCCIGLDRFNIPHSNITDEGVRVITTKFNITNINLTNSAITDKSLEYISRCDIVKIRISGCKSISEEGLISFVRSTDLQTLMIAALSTYVVSDLLLRNIATYSRNLNRLVLNNSEITDQGIKYISTLPYLEGLEIYGCTLLTHYTPVILGRNTKQLRQFICGGCPRITLQSLNFLVENCPHLNLPTPLRI